jgi:hypothetical protein
MIIFIDLVYFNLFFFCKADNIDNFYLDFINVDTESEEDSKKTTVG